MSRKVNYRLKILEKLSEGPKKFNELRKATGSSEATIQASKKVGEGGKDYL